MISRASRGNHVVKMGLGEVKVNSNSARDLIWLVVSLMCMRHADSYE